MKKYSNRFSFIKRIDSFKHAFNGLKILIYEEHNARIHLLASLFIIILGLIVKLDLLEWLLIIFSICLVLTVETINSAIENLADFITLKYDFRVKKIKDLSALAVLICSICAVIIGSLIFIPKLILLY